MTDHPRSLFVTVALTWLYEQIHAQFHHLRFVNWPVLWWLRITPSSLL